MKTIVALFLACFATALFGQAPPIQRNPFSTNRDPVIPFNGVIKYLSPANGNNAITDARTNYPNFMGQIGIGQDNAVAGGSVFIFGARSTNIGDWSEQISIPAGLVNVGDLSNMPTNTAPGRLMSFYMNGNPRLATRSNILSGAALIDSNFRFVNVNPYSANLLTTPMFTTNKALNFYGNGTFNSVIMTNSEGNAVFWFDPFGLTMGSINPEWPAGATNQAGAEVLILGGIASNPFHISENITIAGETDVSQHPFFTIDRRGHTNAALPVAVGFPIFVANVWEPTQANWKWGASLDPRTGEFFVTNGVTWSASNYVNSTNLASGRFGRFAEAGTAEWNFAGSVSFNAPTETGLYEAWTFDGANAHRLGFQAQQANYAKLAYAAGSPFQIAQSSSGDLQSGQTTAVLTNMLDIDGDMASVRTAKGLIVSNRVSGNFVTVTQANIGYKTSTVSGAGNGNTNYTLLAYQGAQYLGSSNVNISAIMGYTAGTMYKSTVIITNLSGNNWGLSFSQVTNRWHFNGAYTNALIITNSPSNLTNGTAFKLELTIENTNVWCDWQQYVPGL